MLTCIVSAPCKFISCSTSGAILILPSGAVRQNLNKNGEEEFRKLAEKYGLDWCGFAGSQSLYLITGVHKTSSWYLASFHDVRPTGQILLERDDAGRYSWNSSCKYRKSPSKSLNENQAVLISGFKIEVRGWGAHTAVKKLVPYPRSIRLELTSLARFLVDILIFFWRWMVSRYVFKLSEHNAGVGVRRVPALSQVSTLTEVTEQTVVEQLSSLFTLLTSSTVTSWIRLVVKHCML